MDETKLKELGLTDEQIASVKTMFGAVEETVQQRIDDAVTAKETELTDAHQTELDGLSAQLVAKDRDYAAKDFFGQFKFTSSLAKDMAMAKFNEAGLEFKDGKLVGADKFMNDLKKDNPDAFATDEPTVQVNTGGGGSAGGGSSDGVEAAFYEINPNLK